MTNNFYKQSEIPIDISSWLAAHSLALVIAVLVLLFLLLLLVGIRLLRSSARKPPVKSAPRPTSSRYAAPPVILSGKPTRWQLLDPSGNPIPLQPLPFIIGREQGCHLLLDDPSIAPRHAQIDYDPGWDSLFILDLDSPAGILVNDKPTHKNLLQPGTRLSLGQYTFTLTPVQKA